MNDDASGPDCVSIDAAMVDRGSRCYGHRSASDAGGGAPSVLNWQPEGDAAGAPGPAVPVGRQARDPGCRDRARRLKVNQLLAENIQARG